MHAHLQEPAPQVQNKRQHPINLQPIKTVQAERRFQAVSFTLHVNGAAENLKSYKVQTHHKTKSQQQPIEYKHTHIICWNNLLVKEFFQMPHQLHICAIFTQINTTWSHLTTANRKH